jgi:hypothetical protein
MGVLGPLWGFPSGLHSVARLEHRNIIQTQYSTSDARLQRLDSFEHAGSGLVVEVFGLVGDCAVGHDCRRQAVDGGAAFLADAVA